MFDNLRAWLDSSCLFCGRFVLGTSCLEPEQRSKEFCFNHPKGLSLILTPGKPWKTTSPFYIGDHVLTSISHCELVFGESKETCQTGCLVFLHLKLEKCINDPCGCVGGLLLGGYLHLGNGLLRDLL